MREISKAPEIAKKLVSIIEKKPWLTLFFGLLVIVAFLPGLSKIKADFTHTAFFFKNDPTLVNLESFERKFGNDESLIIAVHSPSGIFDKDSASLIMELTEKMWALPSIIRVTSLSNYSWVHADGDDIIVEPFFPDDQEITDELLAERQKIAMAHEVLPDYLVSKDSKTALLFANVVPNVDGGIETEPIVLAARDFVKKHEKSDHIFHIMGGPTINHSFKESSQQDLKKLIPVLLGLIILTLFISLRSVIGVLLSLTIVFFSILPSLAVHGWTGFPITSVSSILPQILIAIGVADAVHMLTVFRQARLNGSSREDAARYSLLKNFQPTLLTSISTSIGFFSFGTANIEALAGLGVVAGFGVLMAWFVSYFVVGPLLFILPSKIKPISSEEQTTHLNKAKRFTNWLYARRLPLIVIFSLLSLISIYLTLNNTVNSDPYQYFRKGVPLRDASDFVLEKVGGVAGLEIVIDSGKEEGVKDPVFLKRVEEFQVWLESRPHVTRALSIVDILKSTNRSLNGDNPDFYKLPETRELIAQELFLYTMSLPQGMDINDRITIKNDSLRMSVLWTTTNSKNWIINRTEVENKAKEMGFNIMITGKPNLYQSMNPYVVESFVRSISIAIILISILLIVVFRSVKLGLLALIPNCIPLIFGGAAFWLIGKSIDIGSVLVMSVCLGIAVDDTIHILSNYNRLRGEGLSKKESIAEVLAHTSPALIFTTIILVCGFGSLAFASFIPNIYFGIMCSIILSLALITDLTFLLALLTGKDKEELKV